MTSTLRCSDCDSPKMYVKVDTIIESTDIVYTITCLACDTPQLTLAV